MNYEIIKYTVPHGYSDGEKVLRVHTMVPSTKEDVIKFLTEKGFPTSEDYAWYETHLSEVRQVNEYTWHIVFTIPTVE